MEKDTTKKVKTNTKSVQNKGTSNKTTTSKKKTTTPSKSKTSSVNKKSTSKKKSTTINTSVKSTNVSKNTSKNTSSNVNKDTTKKTTSTKKKNTTKKSNTYQYNKRNLDKNKKTEVIPKVKEELIDESILNDKVVEQEKFNFEEENKNTLVETVESILEDIKLPVKEEEEVLEDTGIIPNVVDKEFEQEIIEDILEEKESNLVDEDFEKEILEDILEDQESIDDFLNEREERLKEIKKYEVIEELDDTEILEDDNSYNTLRYDLYNLYEKEEELDKKITKEVTDIEDKFLLVDNILTEETRENIIPDNVFVEEEGNDEEYYNVILWDSIIGFLLVVFTMLVIGAIWFIVYLTTY